MASGLAFGNGATLIAAGCAGAISAVDVAGAVPAFATGSSAGGKAVVTLLSTGNVRAESAPVAASADTFAAGGVAAAAIAAESKFL